MSRPTPLPEPLLDVEQLSKILGVRARWCYEHLDEIPHVRVGRYIRFEPAAIRDFIAERRGGPAANGGGDGVRR